MKWLLQMIHFHKKVFVKYSGKECGGDWAWDTNDLKRKFEGDKNGGVNKHWYTDALRNGEPSRGEVR